MAFYVKYSQRYHLFAASLQSTKTNIIYIRLTVVLSQTSTAANSPRLHHQADEDALTYTHVNTARV